MNENTTQPAARRRSTWLAGAVLVVGITLATGACSGGDTKDAASGSNASASSSSGALVDLGDGNLDACALLTTEEIGTWTSTPVQGPGEGRVLGTNHSCTWKLADDGNFVAQVSVFGSATDAQLAFDSSAESVYAGAAPVEKVGDKALFKTGTSLGTNDSDLDVLLGKATVNFHHDAAGATLAQGQMSILSQSALSRISQ